MAKKKTYKSVGAMAARIAAIGYTETQARANAWPKGGIAAGLLQTETSFRKAKKKRKNTRGVGRK